MKDDYCCRLMILTTYNNNESLIKKKYCYSGTFSRFDGTKVILCFLMDLIFILVNINKDKTCSIICNNTKLIIGFVQYTNSPG